MKKRLVFTLLNTSLCTMFLLYLYCSLLLVFSQKFRSPRFVTWNKVTYNCLLLKAELNWQVEASQQSSILWAVQFAKSENWDHVIFEGDAKVCFNPLSLLHLAPLIGLLVILLVTSYILKNCSYLVALVGSRGNVM